MRFRGGSPDGSQRKHNETALALGTAQRVISNLKAVVNPANRELVGDVGRSGTCVSVAESDY
jgi:hypothetical protein